MDPKTTAVANQCVDLALAGLMDRAHNQVMHSSKSDGSNKRQRMSQQLELSQLSHKTLAQRIQYKTTSTIRSLNSLAPIHRLSNEILVMIFTLASGVGSTGRPSLRRLVVLGLVSKDWSGIIFGTPSLWAHISSGVSSAENTVAIQRSKQRPLQVDYRRYDRWDGTAFIDLASREAYRWQSASFRLGSYPTFTLLREFVFLSVPMLEELKIDCEEMAEEFSAENSINLFGGRADRLRHVNIRHFPIPWCSQLLSRLVTLKILEPSIWLGASTSEITDMLRRCPELRAFELGYSGKEEIRVSDAIPPETAAVHLPVLTSFKLRLETPGAALNRILFVRIPACREFSLQCLSPTNNIFSDVTCHFTAALLSAIRSLPEITVALSATILGLYDSNNSVINIRLCHNSPWEDLAWLIERTGTIITWPPITTIIWCSEPLPFLRVVDILRRMNSITNLKLSGNSDQYIALLTNPTLNNGACEWVLPNLRELSLQACPENSLQLLTELSEKRQGRENMDIADRVRLGLPAMLEKIHVRVTLIEPESGPFYTALRELKGEDWDGNLIG